MCVSCVKQFHPFSDAFGNFPLFTWHDDASISVSLLTLTVILIVYIYTYIIYVNINVFT